MVAYLLVYTSEEVLHILLYYFVQLKNSVVKQCFSLNFRKYFTRKNVSPPEIRRRDK